MKDYWGKDLNVSVGRDNFDQLRFEYFRDTTVALEAFKADTVDWRTENSAKNWATAYDFPAVADKRVIKEEFPINSQGIMQAFAFNIRRAKFQDWRVRLAFNFAFDFACARLGNKRLARIAIIAITTSNSMRVKAYFPRFRRTPVASGDQAFARVNLTVIEAVA